MNYIYHGRDLRKGRASIPNQAYLVTNVTQDRKPIFLDFSISRILIRCMRFQADQQSCKTLAFVVMPDHWHWLLSLGDQQSLSKIIQAVKRHSARQINCHTGRIGAHVWQKGFHDHAVRKEEDLQQIARYIVANPLHAGLVDTIGDYPHWDAVWL